MVDNANSRSLQEFWDARQAYEKAVQKHGADSPQAKTLKPRMDKAQKNLPAFSPDRTR